MKKLCFTLCLIASTAMAGERVNESMDVDDDVVVDIEHLNGNAKIVGWDKSVVEVTGELDDRAEDFIFKKRGNRVLIEVEMPQSNRRWGNNSGGGDDLTIRVPMNAKVSYTAVNADVSIENVHGGSNMETVNGDIEADSLSGRIVLETVNGGIEAEDLKGGDINFETVNGNIDDENSSGSDINFESVNGNIASTSSIEDIQVETVNGSIEMELGDVRSLDIGTVNGSVEIDMNLLENGSVEGSSVSGKMELNFQKDVAAKFDIEAHAGGRIKNNITDDKMQKAKYGPRRWLEFSTGGGDARVEISTVGGRIELGIRNN